MAKKFLGTGWAFPLRANESSHEICVAEYEDSIRQAIWIILGTAPGERAMRPDFGCGIHDLVFAAASPSTCDRLAGQVREALLRWEPRIDVEEVQVRQDGRGAKLFLHVTYRVRATNNAFNMVYPFYLEGRGA